MGTRYHYDAMDKLVSTVDSVGSVLATPRDLYGNIHKEINPNTYDPITGDGEGIVYDYDAEDRRIRIRYPDGGVERIFYDANGNIIKKVQPTDYDPASDDGPGYTYEYDEVNRLVQITAPSGAVEKRYVYNLRGDIVKVIDAAGYLAGNSDEARVGTLYRYNPAGWLMEKREPVEREADGAIRYRLTEYRHDKAGNVIEERRYQDSQTAESAAGPVLSIFFAYDKNNRLVQVSDSTGAAVEYGYNSANQRVREKRRLRDGLHQIFLWRYDAAGRMVEQSSSIDRADGSQGFATTAKWRALLVSSAGVIIQQSQRKFLQDCLPQIEIVDICSPYQFSVYPDSSYDFIISMTPLAGAAKPVADVSHMTKAQRVQFIEEFLFEKLDSRGGA